MTVKANLKIILMANDVVVAESEEPQLWQQVFGAMNTGKAMRTGSDSEGERRQQPDGDGESHGKNLVATFAKWLELPQEDVEGACSPSTEPPYLQLDERYWEAFRKGLPARGPYAIGPMQLAGTLLALWFRHARLGSPSQAQGQAVLDTIGLRDKNPSRAIRNCEWVQTRSGGFQINPAMISKAMEVARAYCNRSPLTRSNDRAGSGV